MNWTGELPKRAGYYWYLGPVMKRDFDKVKNGADIRDCTWGPIIAGVGICLKEIPSGDGNPHHERMWSEGRIVVEFYGSTVRRTLAEMPRDVLWAGPVTPPVSGWAWHLQPKDKIQAKPFEAEIDASEITAWSEACRKAEGYFAKECERAIDCRLSSGLSEDPYDEPPEGYGDFGAYQKSKGWCST